MLEDVGQHLSDSESCIMDIDDSLQQKKEHQFTTNGQSDKGKINKIFYIP